MNTAGHETDSHETDSNNPGVKLLTAEDYSRTYRVTPMLKQYLEIKRTHPDCLLFYRLGDFYECFFEDARLASSVLDITLTGRGKGEERYPMAGIPHHAAASYIGRLVEAGNKVAICDQVEDSSEAKGLVKREVVKIVTPGMVVDDDLLDPRTERIVGTFLPDETDQGGSLAFLDLSTGAFRAARLQDRAGIAEELFRADPRELLIPENTDESLLRELTARIKTVSVSRREESLFSPGDARNRLSNHFGVSTLAGFGIPDGPEGNLLAGAAGALIRYAAETHREAAVHIDRLDIYDPGSFLVLDGATCTNLEVLATLHGGKKAGSLLGYMDKTGTAMGGRRLREWLSRPLTDQAAIEDRLDAVELFVNQPSLCEKMHQQFKALPDIERILGRLALGQGNPRDMRGLQGALASIPSLKECLLAGIRRDCENYLDENACRNSLLVQIAEKLHELPELADLLDRALVDDPPLLVRDGKYIRKGYDENLDELVELSVTGRDQLLRIETEERKKTGIQSLKVRYNRVFGYYIEVTKANLHLVPEEYIRRQTTANAERFITSSLQDWERKVVTADEKRRILEAEIFEDLRKRILEYSNEIGILAEAISVLDVCAAFAVTAIAMDFRRPSLTQSKELIIEDGRHPVVEAALKKEAKEQYVPGDTVIAEDKPFLIVTGPNMAGKSTVMRMAAITVLLAQTGSFVPARSARVGICDRIFTRVGASDDLAGGRSTFMVEMTECASIINRASERSLVILDEIGRGTSTYDGLSIAWAVAEDLHDRVGCRTMFATHYHELTDLALERDGVVNYTVAIREWKDQVIFLRRLVEGAANRSYGIQVAKLAGLPKRVLDRASEVLANLESSELDKAGRPNIARHADEKKNWPPSGQLSLFGYMDEDNAQIAGELKRIMKSVNPDDLSPREALDLVYRIMEIIRE